MSPEFNAQLVFRSAPRNLAEQMAEIDAVMEPIVGEDRAVTGEVTGLKIVDLWFDADTLNDALGIVSSALTQGAFASLQDHSLAKLRLGEKREYQYLGPNY